MRRIAFCALLPLVLTPALPSAVQRAAAQTVPSGDRAREAAPESEARRLTLDRAIDLAHANNPAYRRSVHDLELNEVENREFWIGFLPQPRINVLNTNMQWNRQATGTDNFGNPIPNPEFRMVQSAVSDQRASLAFELDLGDFFDRQMTRLRAENREVATRVAGSALASDVRIAFLDVQERREALALEEALVEVQGVNREIAERRFRLAQVDRPDRLGAELDYVEQQNQLAESRSRLGQALLRLRNLIGDPELGSFEIAPSPLRVFDPSDLDEEALVRSAVDGGPDVRRAQVQVQLAERQVSLSRSEWLPTLGISAGTGRRQLSRESGDAFLQPLPDSDWDRTVSFSLAFPDLGTYFSRDARGRREDVQVRNAEASLRETRMSVEEEVRGLLLELESQHRRLDLQERRAGLARENLELQQERYRLGQIDYLQLQQSARTASDAERQALQSRYAFERALIDLERALGRPLEPRRP